MLVTCVLGPPAGYGSGLMGCPPGRDGCCIGIAAGVEGDPGIVQAVEEGVGKAGGNFLDQRQLPAAQK